MAPTLYYMPEGATSRAALFLIRYLKMDVQLKTVRTYMNEHMDPTFLKLNPTHTVPILDDNGFVLINSHAIGMYLVEQYGSKTNLFGTTIKERALIIQRLFFNEMLFTEMRIMLKPIIAGESTKYEEKILHHIFEMLAFLEGFLKTQDFVAGKYVTLADFYLVNIILTLMVSYFYIFLKLMFYLLFSYCTESQL